VRIVRHRHRRLAPRTALGADADIAKNGGQPIYATYVVPTTRSSQPDQRHGFYVFGDAEMTSNNPP
jgi:hypothetical protein